MHRLAAVPGDLFATPELGGLIEQTPAPVVFLSSAATDLAALDGLLAAEPEWLAGEIRALPLAALSHPATIDHYVGRSLSHTQLVAVRLLGGRGHWSYGLERLQRWVAKQGQGRHRHLLVMAGTAEQEQELAALGTLPLPLAVALGRCWREGGPANLRQVLCSWNSLLAGEEPAVPLVIPSNDPERHDWQEQDGPRVGVLLYRSLMQAGDLAFMGATLQALRQQGLVPRALWVSSLREPVVQQAVADWFGSEGVQAVLCATGFASVRFEEAGLGAPLWERLGVPVLQVLSSTRPRQGWQDSSIGLGPLDLSLQVALPELDGRIITRVGAFKETTGSSSRLLTALQRLCPDEERLAWIAQLTSAWVKLRQTPVPQRRLALVLANYPNRNGRLANGVGLDTPASTALMLNWLAEAGYDLGDPLALPADGAALMDRLLAGRSNDPESDHRPALDHLPLAAYECWYGTLPVAGRQLLETVWGPPKHDRDLEQRPSGPAFPIRGTACGSVLVLIQPERGYDRDPSLSYHSPDLPPTHAYLAHYLWMRQSHGCQVVVHVGKHGNLEWLPGKAVGLSGDCFPEWALGPVPHIYPFIVNDPGEGSQAKRRAQAVILDHLTPPLGRAGLHGGLQELEALLDEYWQATQLGGARAGRLRSLLAERLEALELPLGTEDGLEERLAAADGYLCELKEAQIRLGLHVYGCLPEQDLLAELLLCLARPPQAGTSGLTQAGTPGLTQALAQDLGLDLDPWNDPEEQRLTPADAGRWAQLALASPQPSCAPAAESLRCVGDGVAWLEAWALDLVRHELALQRLTAADEISAERTIPAPVPLAPGVCSQRALRHLRDQLLPRLLACAEAERHAFLHALGGGRIAAGPSGAPSRGRPDVLPTGRNFYSVDLRGLPTEAAWDLGRRSAELLLELHRQEEGEDLRALVLSVWGTSTMRNGGEDIAQALALMGVRPVWDGPTRRMVDLEVIPLSLLGRPRVDVTLRISGLFRDAFPQLVRWVNTACQLVANLNEEEADNPLAAAAKREGHASRVFGSAPGAYGAGLQGLIDSGHWENRGDLGEAFLAWSSWRYDSEAGSEGGLAVAGDRQGLEQRLATVQVVLHNQDNREHDLLDSDDYYQFQGGLSAAVEKLQGRAPSLWFGDHSRQSRPRMHRIEKEFDKVLRSRLLNPRWIEAMAAHGYKGGFEMAASLDYLFAYGASTGRVPQWSYGAICDSWLASQQVLDFLRDSNPWALRDMAERLLEAHHRELWTVAQPSQLEHLREMVLQSEAWIEKR
jgi:cobaltochelatase CobN